MSPGQSIGVRTLLGDPRRAIVKLSIPMVVAMSIQTIYNLADAFWVAGLGADALAAVGFFFPFFFLIIAVAAGIGMGGGSAISRRIGARDRSGADNVADHTMVLMIVSAVILTVASVFLAGPIFRVMGSGDVTELSLDYAYPIFVSIVFIFFSNIAGAILRAEGDAKRAMYAMVLGGVLNIVLDPIFIYTLDLGVLGASLATVLSIMISTLPMFWWIFLRRSTYVRIGRGDFSPDASIVRDIFRVGVPSTFMQMSMAINMFVLVSISSRVGGTDGVAVLSTGWRVVTLATMPLIGISTAVMSVTGAAYGARSIYKLKESFLYSVRMSFLLELGIAVLTFAMAYPVALAFTRTGNAEHLRGDLVTFLRIICFFYPTVAFGMLSSSMFQGVGRGFNSLSITFLRTLILMPPFALFFAYVMDLGLDGIWIGIVAANVLGGIISFIWARYFIRSTGKHWEASGVKEMVQDPSFG